MVDFATWKHGELMYCYALVLERGNTSVPSDSVPGYLSHQAISARHDKRFDISCALERAAVLVFHGDWCGAQERLDRIVNCD